MAAATLAPAAAVAGGGCHNPRPSEGSGTTVSMKNNCFTATATWVDAGDTVRWINNDSNDHQVMGWGFDLQAESMPPGSSYEYTFTRPGVYSYACWLHPGMIGAIVVGTPQRPSALVDAPVSGDSGEIRGPAKTGAETASKPVASERTTSGTTGSAAAIAAMLAGTIGFVAGRRKREGA